MHIRREAGFVSAACSPAESFPIIDAHIHTDFSGELEPLSKIPMTQVELLREMSEAGVVGAIADTGENEENYQPLAERNIFHRYGLGAKVDTKT